MKILVSNDDGCRAPGIACLVRMLRAETGVSRVEVVAPERDRSGASNSLTLDLPLHATTLDNGFISVNGTPTDCVHLALTGLLEESPDLVVAGINAGANLGDDVLYSGTVAAAMEGRFLGRPAIAVSLAEVGQGLGHYDSAAQVVQYLLQRMACCTLPENTILNVNVPSLPWEQIQGLVATRLGHRHKAEPVVKDTDPRGRLIYWVGPPGKAQDAGPGTDFYAVSQGQVSVTPLLVDLTRHSALESTAAWLRA